MLGTSKLNFTGPTSRDGCKYDLKKYDKSTLELIVKMFFNKINLNSESEIMKELNNSNVTEINLEKWNVYSVNETEMYDFLSNLEIKDSVKYKQVYSTILEAHCSYVSECIQFNKFTMHYKVNNSSKVRIQQILSAEIAKNNINIDFEFSEINGIDYELTITGDLSQTIPFGLLSKIFVKDGEIKLGDTQNLMLEIK